MTSSLPTDFVHAEFKYRLGWPLIQPRWLQTVRVRQNLIADIAQATDLCFLQDSTTHLRVFVKYLALKRSGSAGGHTLSAEDLCARMRSPAWRKLVQNQRHL